MKTLHIHKPSLIKSWFAILLSLLIAVCLSILPMPDWAHWWRPAWVTLVLLYWLIMLPEYVGLGLTWCAGIYLDVLNGTVLGEHAFALTLLAYLTLSVHRQLRLYPSWQQALYILAILVVYHLSLFIIQWISGQFIMDLRFWISPIISMFFWPWIYWLLSSTQRSLN